MQDFNLEHEFENLQRHVTSAAKALDNTTALVGELKLMHGELMEYESEMTALLDLVPGTRRRRSICDGFGRLVSSLTGLMDDEDRDTIQAGLGGLQDKLENLEAEVSPNKAIVRNMLNGTMKNAEILNSMARDVVTNGNAIGKLESDLQLEAKLRQLSFWIAKIRFERAQLRLGLEKAMKGVLVAELLSPSKFLAVLRRIEDNLAENFRLVTKVTMKRLQIFYDLSAVKLHESNSELVVIIELPLRRVGLDFKLWKILAVPVFNPILNKFIKFVVGDFLIVATDFKLHAVLSARAVQECRKSANVTVCPAQVPLSMDVVDTCEFCLFTGKSQRSCEKMVFPEGPEGYFMRMGSEWIFSVMNTTKIGVKCGERHEFRDLVGAGVLRGLKHCDVSTDRQLMLGGVELAAQLDGEWEDAVIPLFDGPAGLTKAEELSLAEERERGELVESVKQYTEHAKGTVALSAVLSHLAQQRRERPWLATQTHLNGLSVFVIVATVLGFAVAIRLFRSTLSVLSSPIPGRRGQ